MADDMADETTDQTTDETAQHMGQPGADQPASAIDRALPEQAYDEIIATHEERLADARRSAIEAGRRKGGLAGAAMAGAMLAVSEIYEGPKQDDKPVTVEASSDPDDVDRDGIGVQVGEVEVEAPPLPALEPVVGRDREHKRPQV